MDRFINSELEQYRATKMWCPVNMFKNERDTRVTFLELSPRARTERLTHGNYTPRMFNSV